ncbi:hypothetical protein MPNB_4590 [Mycoplasmoides pneumoniae]|uniref:Uncharacterized protein n=1 Tax=Mycoplasmoides pneumoniae 309 TaxID=1112856 RepID=A0AB33HQF1_MYCPM|nr:hypothetical protein MPNA4590 [Mycoplasmoides pneumoniae 309]BAV19957.1 hypothetical protein MPNB_4590 [Mycoplasmoides pneumoniae]BAV20695.1 hypothetical protein MPNC_4590 [Mycoplasmoides pneumoniae]
MAFMPCFSYSNKHHQQHLWTIHEISAKILGFVINLRGKFSSSTQCLRCPSPRCVCHLIRIRLVKEQFGTDEYVQRVPDLFLFWQQVCRPNHLHCHWFQQRWWCQCNHSNPREIGVGIGYLSEGV